MNLKGLPRLALAVAVLLGASLAPRRAHAEEEMEQALGAATAVALYNTQIVLGMAADAFAKGAYDADSVKQIVAEQQGMMKTLNEHLQKVGELEGTKEADKKTLEELSGVIEKLQETAEALLAYVDEQSDENAAAWQEKRKASYAALAKVLGIGK